ncbi:hypothetical protein K523DRAFT_115847 [Schizophyllum commune Tattone D]|nr:hypothetical protein K523DRAFT_115847 [Schizophyllum commune Tattone D]
MGQFSVFSSLRPFGVLQPQCSRRCLPALARQRLPKGGCSTKSAQRRHVQRRSALCLANAGEYPWWLRENSATAYGEVSHTRLRGSARHPTPEEGPVSCRSGKDPSYGGSIEPRGLEGGSHDYRDMAGRASRMYQASSWRNQAKIRRPTDESGVCKGESGVCWGIPAFLVWVHSRYDWESYVRLPSSSNACGLVRQRTWVMDGRQGAADPTWGRGGALSLLGGGR